MLLGAVTDERMELLGTARCYRAPLLSRHLAAQRDELEEALRHSHNHFACVVEEMLEAKLHSLADILLDRVQGATLTVSGRGYTNKPADRSSLWAGQ